MREIPVAYFDGPAGSQVPQAVVDAVRETLLHHNANCGAPFATSQETDGILREARNTLADLLQVDDPGEITFGPNMTTLTLSLSRALAKNMATG